MNAEQPASRRAAFLDRDGVINVDHGYVYRREDFQFVPGVLEGARRLHELGFALVVVTNQSGIGRGFYSVDAFMALTEWMREQFALAGAPLAKVYYCPHHPTRAVGAYRCVCDCRKPAPGMLLMARDELSVDLARSVMFGDQPSDLQAAEAAGVPIRIVVGTDGRVAPSLPEPEGLATAAFRSVDDALRDRHWLASEQKAARV